MKKEKIQEIIKEYYNLNTSDVYLFQDGYDNEIYKFTANNKTYALRIAKKNKSLNDASFEVDLYKFLQKEGFPVIKPIFSNQLQSQYFVYEWMGGEKVLCSKEHKPDIGLCRKAGAVLAKLHKDTANFKPQNSPSREMDTEILKLLSQKEKFCRVFNKGDEFILELDKIASDISQYTKRKALIHNDFRAQNLLVDASQNIVAVLDFDWSCMGEPMKDVAHALVEWSYPDGLGKHWEDCWQAFYEGYSSHTPVNDSDLKYWILFSCISDTCSYLSGVLSEIDESNEDKLDIRSYMYTKFKYFKEVL